MNLTDISAAQLRRAAAVKDRMAKLQKKLSRILGSSAPAAPVPDGRKRKKPMSAATKKKLSAAHKARWAKIRADQKK